MGKQQQGGCDQTGASLHWLLNRPEHETFDSVLAPPVPRTPVQPGGPLSSSHTRGCRHRDDARMGLHLGLGQVSVRPRMHTSFADANSAHRRSLTLFVCWRPVVGLAWRCVGKPQLSTLDRDRTRATEHHCCRVKARHLQGVRVGTGEELLDAFVGFARAWLQGSAT